MGRVAVSQQEEISLPQDMSLRRWDAFSRKIRLILPSASSRLCMREPASILSFKAPSG
jgi:hypothetical protein